MSELFKLDFAKLAVCVKTKRGGRGLREVADEIFDLSPSTLSRIEGQRYNDLSVSTLLSICEWLKMRPDEFIIDTSDQTYFKPDFSLADEIKILINSSDLDMGYGRVLIAMMDAGLDMIRSTK